MWLNRIVAVVLAIACAASLGRHLVDAADAPGWTFAYLELCVVAAVVAAVQLLRNAEREPALFAALAYTAFGAIVIVGDAVAGDHTRAVITAVTLPLVPGLLLGEPRTRGWINRMATYRS